jgi:hypothetical protein
LKRFDVNFIVIEPSRAFCIAWKASNLEHIAVELVNPLSCLTPWWSGVEVRRIPSRVDAVAPVTRQVLPPIDLSASALR